MPLMLIYLFIYFFQWNVNEESTMYNKLNMFYSFVFLDYATTCEK